MSEPVRVLLLRNASASAGTGSVELLDALQRVIPGLEVTTADDLASLETALSDRGPDLVIADILGLSGPGMLLGDALKTVVEARRRARMLTEPEARSLSIGRIAGGVAHDLNNLLTAVFGFTAFAKASLPENHGAIQSLEMVEQAAEQATVATKMLLSFTARTTAQKHLTDVSAVFSEASRMLRRMLPPSCEVVKEEGGPQLWAHADGTQILHAILALGLMAHEAAAARGRPRITFRMDVESGSVRLDIAATPQAQQESQGAGQSPASGSLVSGSLVSGSLVSGSLVSGSPVSGSPVSGSPVSGSPAARLPDLPAVRRIIEEHGGRLAVETGDESGAAFVIVLTTVSPEPQARGAGGEMGRQASGNPLVVLAEPHDYLREIAAQTLRLAGYEVVTAKDGYELIEVSRRHRGSVRLLVCEENLRGRTGLECLHALRAAGEAAPAIVITDGVEGRHEGIADRRMASLEKPFKTSDLLRLARTLVQEAAGLTGSP